MKTITEPKVYLVGRQAIAVGAEGGSPGLLNFLHDHDIDDQYFFNLNSDPAEELAETAGRLCYMSFSNPRPGGSEAYFQNIVKSGHGSVLEHGVFNFIVTGISRSCSHELVRHRAGFGYSQLSQRYVDESVAEYVCPKNIAEDPELFDIWADAISYAHAKYKELSIRLDRKIRAPFGDTPLMREQETEIRKAARQSARSVLPNATETKVFTTANVRAIRHFLELRGSRHAEPEIRAVAFQILKIMQHEAPLLFADYRIETTAGVGEIKTDFTKV